VSASSPAATSLNRKESAEICLLCEFCLFPYPLAHFLTSCAFSSLFIFICCCPFSSEGGSSLSTFSSRHVLPPSSLSFPVSFTVSVAPGLISSLEEGSSAPRTGAGPTGSPEVVTTRQEAEEVEAAYRKGLKDAESNLRHHLVAQKVR